MEGVTSSRKEVYRIFGWCETQLKGKTMNAAISKLKSAYNALNREYSAGNKVRFDSIVWSELPKLWESFQTSDSKDTQLPKKRQSITSIVNEFISKYSKTVTMSDISHDIGETSISVSESMLRHVVRRHKNYRVLTYSEHSSFFEHKKIHGGSIGALVFDDLKHFGAEPDFTKFIECHYTKSDSFTKISDIVADYGKVISEDVVLRHLDKCGHSVYLTPDLRKAVMIRKNKQTEFATISEVLKGLK